MEYQLTIKSTEQLEELWAYFIHSTANTKWCSEENCFMTYFEITEKPNYYFPRFIAWCAEVDTEYMLNN